MFESMLRQMLAELAERISSASSREVVEELDAGEPVVAIEWLCDALFEEEVTMEKGEVLRLIDLVRMMESDRYSEVELMTLLRDA